MPLALLVSATLEPWAKAPHPIPLDSYGQRGPGDARHYYSQHSDYSQHSGMLVRIFLALGVGLLLPLAGTITLLGGEALLIVRLRLWDEAIVPGFHALVRIASWGSAFRMRESKWGLAATMIFSPGLLQDSLAESEPFAACSHGCC